MSHPSSEHNGNGDSNGNRMMICRFRFKPFLVTPQHDHPHEQMTIVERGRVRFFIEGKEQIASAGDVLHFPSNCWHGATMMDEEVVLIDIFLPCAKTFLTVSNPSTDYTDNLRNLWIMTA